MALSDNPKRMALSLTETAARLFVTRFLRNYISSGCLILLEEGGTVFTFEGSKKDCSLKSVLKVHSPHFYWKVMTQADLGIADAYISGDFSFDDKDRGLLNLFMILIKLCLVVSSSSFSLPTEILMPQNQTRKGVMPRLSQTNFDIADNNHPGFIMLLVLCRRWWQPVFFTATIATAKYVFQHALRKNSLTQARRNISRHYDLSNDLFSLFLGETMMYSTAIFKTEDEELNTAQLRKISTLIDKARIDENHEVLEIGCGWGALAIEAVKQTGCRYTGITLSEEQLKFAEKKVKDAGLQDRIKFLLCDYRQLPSDHKYDRIIICEVLEHVGHEFVDEFFSCCDSLLAENGILVLQFISILDELYDEYWRSPGFIKEYIFPGGCLLSLSRLTSAMAASSRLCVEHLENIGHHHYYQTLRCWRNNFLERQR
ncbi:putative cyclopropane-fatty-acyl-phospholipid synthase [Rosa chinensis]|uniref:Putative cyclopropane-fatty-acyl-phospholipid synthase n=1 Tax=Rosa chinensis TaxID=74649 RepID=A0A2P6PRK9_ROSCH|nr:putative cyclopropane-fatty-acyl-phospholipid synthase [Rosa chinensis]